jgi:thiamine-phosphate pyrophosphorylase
MPADPTRILDAAINRAAEGLRVVEDYVRFALDDGYLTAEVKRLRHDLAAAASQIPPADRHAARDTPHDVGTAISTATEAQRTDAWAVCQANLERTKQSLRSLEEFGKLVSPAFGAAIESLRYRLYAIEAAIGRTVDAVQRLADVRLCVLIDGCESPEAFERLVCELIAAGVGMFQLRDKQLPVRQLVERARRLVYSVRERREPPTSRDQAWSRLALPYVIINDRPAVAAAVDADGVHLGQDDFTVKDARAVLGPRKLIGVSTHSLEQARQAVLDGANYLGVGPTFPSATKQFDAFPGLNLLRTVAAEIRLPAFAIGGIHAGNLDDVLAAGVSRIAVSAAVTAAPCPGDAARELLSKLHPTAVEPQRPAPV